MRHLASAEYWDWPAGGDTGRLFLAFGGAGLRRPDKQFINLNLIYLLNLQIFQVTLAAILKMASNG